MHPTEHAVAWDHAPTRNAWTKHMVMNVAGLAGWSGGWFLLIGISTNTPNWVVWIFMPYFIYGFYRFAVQLSYFPWAVRMRRVLRQYPWQLLKGLPRGLGRHPEARDDGMWFEFGDPMNGERKIPMVFIRHQRSYWWLKRIGGPRTAPGLIAQIEPLWFAGDPRFLGVIAAPGRDGNAPKRLHVLFQRPALDRRCAPVGWDADATDLDRARRAGALVPDPATQPGV